MIDSMKQSKRDQVKAWLRSYQTLQAEAEHIKDLINDLEESVMAPGGPNLSGMPKGGTGGDAMTRYVEKKDQLLARYAQKMEQIVEEQGTIENAIEILSSRERLLIRIKYLQGRRWDDVCDAMHYSWRQTHNIHACALDKLAEAKASQNVTAPTGA